MNTYRLKYYPDKKYKANYYQLGMEDGFLNKEKGIIAPKGTYTSIKEYGNIQRANGFFNAWIPYILSEDNRKIYLDRNDVIGFDESNNKYRFTEKEFYEFFIPDDDGI